MWGSVTFSATAQVQQESDRISGRVVERDAPEYGVVGATIRVEGTDRFTLADDDGEFSIAVPASASSTLVVEAPEFESRTVEFSETEREEPVEIGLDWKAIETATVTVVAPRIDPDPVATTRLTPREMNAAPHRNAEEVLRQVPGLTLLQHGSEGKGHQFFMRGFDATHGADLTSSVDGIPLNEWSNIHGQGYLDLGIILPEMISEVTVTKGPINLDQGAFAMAGSADYRLGVDRAARGFCGAYTIGTTNRHRLFAGYSPPDGTGSQFAGIGATYDDGFGEGRSLRRAIFNGRVRLLDLGDHGELHLLGLGGISRFDLPGPLRNEDIASGRVDFYDSYDPDSRGESARGITALTYDAAIGEHEVLITGYGGYRLLDVLQNTTGFLEFPDRGDRREQHQQTWSFGLLGQHEIELIDELSLRTGVGIRGDFFAQREDYVDRDVEVHAERRSLEGLQLLAHSYAGLRWAPSDELHFNAGARAALVRVDITDRLADDAESSGTLAVATPRLSAHWRPHKKWRLFAAYGRGYRPPEARAFSTFTPDRTGFEDDEDDRRSPEITVADTVEMGTSYDVTDALTASLSTYATFIERETVFDHVSGLNLELGSTRRVGAELHVHSHPLSWLELSGDLNVVDARFTDSGNRVPLVPWLTAGLRGIATHKSGWQAGLRILAIPSRPLPNGATGSALFTADATISYVWEWLRIGLELENLLNRQLREGEYHFASHWRPDEPPSEIPVLHTSAGPPFNARLTVEGRF